MSRKYALKQKLRRPDRPTKSCISLNNYTQHDKLGLLLLNDDVDFN